MIKKRILLAMCMLIMVTTACSSEESTANVEKFEERKQVVVQDVLREQPVKTLELTGTLLPYEEVLVSFEVPGRIISLKLEEGDQVQEGQLLAQLNSTDYQLQLTQSETVVEQSNAALQKINNGARDEEIMQAQLVVEKANLLYEKALEDLNRYAILYEEKAISENDYSSFENRMELAKKDLATAEQSLALIKEGARSEDREMSQAVYEQALLAKEMAVHMLSKTELRSPISGTIISKHASSGQLTSAGTPVYRIGKIDTLKVILPVPDHEISLWREGESILLQLHGISREGKITKRYPAANQHTSTIGVEVILPNPDHDWFAGQVVKASKQIVGTEGVYIPIEAVISSGESNPYAFRFVDGKAIKTIVSIGELQNNLLEIRSGLDEGDQVIVKGVDRLFDGDVVEVVGGTNRD